MRVVPGPRDTGADRELTRQALVWRRRLCPGRAGLAGLLVLGVFSRCDDGRHLEHGGLFLDGGAADHDQPLDADPSAQRGPALLFAEDEAEDATADATAANDAALEAAAVVAAEERAAAAAAEEAERRRLEEAYLSGLQSKIAAPADEDPASASPARSLAHARGAVLHRIGRAGPS